MLCVFDLDGTLISTREANRRAYEEVGADPPANFHQISWNLWTSAWIHDRKNELLPRMLRECGRVLPLMDLALEQRNTIVLSNCSDAALAAMREIWPELQRLTIHNRMNSAAKATHIKKSFSERGAYFDDCVSTCHLVRLVTGWQTVHVLESDN